MVGRKVINGFKGTIDFYVYKGQPCARAWPRSPGKKRAPAVMAQWSAFITAAKLWREVSPAIRQAYQDMAVGTNLTDKDVFTRGYISGTLRFFITVDDLARPE